MLQGHFHPHVPFSTHTHPYRENNSCCSISHVNERERDDEIDKLQPFFALPHNLCRTSEMRDFICETALFLLLCGSAIISQSAALEFRVYWNVPSQQCIKHGVKFPSILKEYGIIVNEGDKFQGEEITIFYESKLGNYPEIDKEGKDLNGGIPQTADLDAHLNKSAKDIQRIIPSKQWQGVGIIDWEAWRPVWEYNWGNMRKYQERSRKVVRDLNPNRTKEAIGTLAAEMWENSTRSWMLDTLGLSRQMRPKGRWGFYLFPDCYNYEGNHPEDFHCSDEIKKGNDKLKWLWEASTALFPSIYVYESHLGRYTFQQRTWYTNGRLKEAQRVSSSEAHIYPYINYSLRPGTMVPKEEFKRVLSQVAASGAQGAIIWGSSASVGSKILCKQLWDYVIEVLGPAVEHISSNANRCSKTVCHGQGRCTWPQDHNVLAWKFMEERLDKDFYAGDITCRCSQGFQDRYCKNFMSTLLYDRCT